MNTYKVSFAIVAILIMGFITSCDKEIDSELSSKLPKEVTTKIDQLIESKMQANNLPSVVVGIWIPGEGNYLQSFGKANLETGVDRQFETPFRIASITKTFTATVILSLVDAGSLKTSDSLSMYLPKFPNAENITIRNLLRMRSGIADFADSVILDEWYKDVYKNYNLDTLIDIMASHSNDFSEPGKKTVYCNGNYVILAKVAEIVSGNDFISLVNDKVFKPLKLTTTSYPKPTNYKLHSGNRGYSWNSLEKSFIDKTELNTSCANAAGAIISNMRDLEIYARALYKGTLLSTQSQQKRLETEVIEGTPSFCGYGEGIIKIGKFYGHNGTIFGFSTEMFYLPEKDAVIVINVNRLDLDDQSKSSELFFGISKIVFPDQVSW
jgi:D-alanyl-D-alanine carboxypeptidase